MKPDIGFSKIRRRVIARVVSEESGRGVRNKDGLRAAELAGGCTGKERFESHALAAKVITRRKGKRHAKRQVYFCRSCSGFHVGSHIF